MPWPEARSQQPEARLLHRSDHKNHAGTQHRQAAIVSLQGLHGSVVGRGNGDQRLTRLDFVVLYRLDRCWS